MVLPRAHPTGMITCTFDDHQEKPTDFISRQPSEPTGSYSAPAKSAQPTAASPHPLGEEFRDAWTGVGRILEAAELGYENIPEYATYHVNMHDHLGTFMKVRDEFVSEPWPAWTAIGITELAIPGARVEIRVTAGP